MKQIIIASLLFLLTLGSIFAVNQFHKDNNIYIALAGSMSSPYQLEGEGMKKGVQMYLDEVNQGGGIDGKTLKLLVFDDQGEEKIARKVAIDIAEDQRIVAVLGHYFSNTSVTAGRIYKEFEIPVITGTAAAENVTQDNSWYFRTMFDSRQEGNLLANYANKILNYSKVAIAYAPEQNYNNSVAWFFEKSFKALGGEITYKTIYDVGENLKDKADTIIADLLRLRDQSPDFLFLSLRENAAIELITSIKRWGLNYPILSNSFLGEGETIVDQFKAYSEEKAKPGYFSNGIYAASPLIFDVVGEKGQHFRNKFIQKYNHAPGWVEANSYEAAKVLVEAIKTAQITDQKSTISQKRQQIQEALLTFSDPENAVLGIDQPLYFNENRTVIRPITIGIYNNQEFVSALTQLKPESTLSAFKGRINPEKNSAEWVIAGNQLMHKTHVAYTGIKINEIRNIEQKSSSFTVDFNLWFRFSPEVDADNIEFVNYAVDRLTSGEQLRLGDPIEEIITDQEIYRLYRLKADFQGNFQFQNYPFDQQDLTIKFRHSYLSQDDLVYVVDVAGMGNLSPNALLERFRKSDIFETISDWTINDVQFFSDSIVQDSTLGKEELLGKDTTLLYSRFNCVVNIKRKALLFSLKNLLPLFFFIIVSYLILFLPFDDISVEAVSGVLLAVVFFHLSLIEALPEGVGYIVALDYAFYIFYSLVVFQLLLVVIGRLNIIHSQSTILENLMKTARVGYVVILGIAVTLFVYNYDLLDDFHQAQEQTQPDVAVTSTPSSEMAAPESNLNSTNAPVTLTLTSVQIDERNAMQRFLDLFQQQNPDIKIKFVPIQAFDYYEILSLLSQQGQAPDIILVPAYDPGQQWYQTAVLAPLGNNTRFQDRFDPSALTAWSTEKGELYAMPFMAVARGIYYNMDLFEKLNLPIPQTWEELLTVAQTIQDAGYIPFANGAQGVGIMDQLLTNLSPNFLGGVEGRDSYLTGKRCFNDDYAIATFQALADLRPFLPPNLAQVNYFDSSYLFADSEAAMWFNGSWAISWLETQNLPFRWNIFAVPPPQGQPSYFNFEPYTAFGINRDSPHVSEAKEVLDWLSTPEALTEFMARLPGFFPLYKQPIPLQNAHIQTFWEIKQTRPTDLGWGSQMARTGPLNGYNLLAKNASEVLKGKRNPQEAANAVQAGLAQWFQPAQRCRLFQ